MVDIYHYTEYAAFLRDWFTATKQEQSFLSYRYISRRTGVDAGYIVHVLQGNKHLSEDGTEAFIRFLKLSKKDATYFRTMVQFNKSRNDETIKDLFKKLTGLRETSAKILSQKQYRYWMQWYYPAVRLTLLNYDFSGNFAELGQRIIPSISEVQAREAVEFLEELKLIQKDIHGVYEVLDLHLYSGDAWTSLAIREFQSQTMELARQSIKAQNHKVREITTLTLAIPADEIETLKEMMRDFRKQVAKWALGIERSNCVVQFNLACFPVSMDPTIKENSY